MLGYVVNCRQENAPRLRGLAGEFLIVAGMLARMVLGAGVHCKQDRI